MRTSFVEIYSCLVGSRERELIAKRWRGDATKAANDSTMATKMHGINQDK